MNDEQIVNVISNDYYSENVLVLVDLPISLVILWDWQNVHVDCVMFDHVGLDCVKGFFDVCYEIGIGMDFFYVCVDFCYDFLNPFDLVFS